MPEPDEFGCPECGAEIATGYGLAMGPGIGTYNYCTVCNWAHKTLDPQMYEDEKGEPRDNDQD